MIDLRLFAGAAWLLAIDSAESVHPGNAVGRDVTLISLLLQQQTHVPGFVACFSPL